MFKIETLTDGGWTFLRAYPTLDEALAECRAIMRAGGRTRVLDQHGHVH